MSENSNISIYSTITLEQQVPKNSVPTICCFDHLLNGRAVFKSLSNEDTVHCDVSNLTFYVIHRNIIDP